MGKPIGPGLGDLERACQLTNYLSGLVETASGQTSLSTPNHLNISLRQPYGVVAAIVPWNFPTVLVSITQYAHECPLTTFQFCHEVPAACGAGNAIIIKVPCVAS
jgi:aldehyde dehydrogenase (NAD+)